MTRDNIDTSNDNNQSSHKNIFNKNNILLKIFFLIIVIFVIFFIVQNIKMQDSNFSKKIIDLTPDNVNKDHDILDFSDDLKNKNETTIHDLTISEIKEKGAEFFYQIIIKNQTEIEELKSEIANLKLEFSKIKNQGNLNKIILKYLELRDKIFQNQECQLDIQSFDLISSGDNFLKQKFDIIKQNFNHYSTQKKLIEDFKILKKEFIINENVATKSDNFLSKLYLQLKKIIIIRNLSNYSSNEIEGQVNLIFKSLENNDYDEVLKILNNINYDKNNIIYKSFLDRINAVILLRNVDKEIINYLKNLQ